MPETTLSLTQREDLRVALHAFLAARHPAAFEPRAIALMLKRRPVLDFDPAESDIYAACEHLVSSGNARMEFGEHGASRHYAATAAGVLEAERKGYV
jgi:hypothetical protein